MSTSNVLNKQFLSHMYCEPLNTRLVTFLFSVGLLVFLPMSSYADDARTSAKRAYFMMEESPFDAEAYEKAIWLAKSAFDSDPDEPWVYVAFSLATLQSGYQSGSWFARKSFEEGTIDRAHQFAEKAIKLGGKESSAIVHLARVFIIERRYRKAWELLDNAYKIEPEDFYVWYYNAVIQYYSKGYEKATSYLDEAERRISRDYQKMFVTSRRQSIARKLGNTALEEKLYKQNISDFPGNAYMYGNYAHFLARNKRYKEAVEFYERAIAIKPYRNARRQLEKARKKAELKYKVPHSVPDRKKSEQPRSSYDNII